MKILILNWRDIKNPSSGGAEILTQEIAKRFVGLGNQVVQFSSYFPGASEEETIDGVRIIRKGYPDIRTFVFSVHFRAFLYYRKEKEKFDVVIDEVHGMPFFTPWYVKGKRVVLVCEVASDLWTKFFGLFFGTLGRLIEKFYLKSLYKDTQYISISQSTKNDLIANGVAEENITVLPMGINVPDNIESSQKEKKTTLIFIGRLTVAKGIEVVLIALKKIIKQNEHCRLWVIGRGDEDYVGKLQKLCQKLKIEGNVTFFGFVPEKKKFLLLARSHLLIHPSVREGFGLTIPEAGYVGTPVVAYNSPGLRDIVKNNYNGILLSRNSPKTIAREVMHVLRNPHLYRSLCNGAQEEARQYNWDNTVKAMLDCLKKL